MKNFVKYIFTVLLLTLFICASNAKEVTEIYDSIDKAERDCISKTADTYEMNRCSQIAQQAWEKDISKNLAELKKILNTQDYKILQLSQVSWENYKNNEYMLIDTVVSYKQGTMYLNFREGWKTELLKQRALILREYLNTLQD